MENHKDKPGFTSVQKIKCLSGDEIFHMPRGRLDDEVVSLSGGWRAYGVLNSRNRIHQPVVMSTGEPCGEGVALGP